VAVASHLALDWTNNYGVHPFWPLSNRWYYGDAVFIVEPWLWAVSVPTLLLAARHRTSRVALGLALVAGLALAWGVALVTRGAAVALTLGAVCALLLTWRLPPAARPAAALGAWLVVELVFATGTRLARARLAPVAAADVVITPGPTNPLCATALLVERDGRGGAARYRLTTASVAALPTLVPVARCAAPPTGATLVMRPAVRPRLAGVAWGDSWEAPLAELATLARTSCQAAAALRFLRSPSGAPWAPTRCSSATCATTARPAPTSPSWSSRACRSAAPPACRRGRCRGATCSRSRRNRGAAPREAARRVHPAAR
jgi:inner membrane protein